MTNDWQSSWDIFVNELTVCLQRGDTTETLADLFGGTEVHWNGVLDEKVLSGLAPAVGIQLPEEIKLDDGRRVLLSGLSLPVNDSAIDKWDQCRIGESVKFTARLESSNSPFPPIELFYYKSGRVTLTIRLRDADPI